jgi:type VI secretion system secreted protein Hcp
MALMAYLMLKGQKQGAIKGGVIAKGREGAIGVIAVSHSIVSPRDPQSGLPTGKRMHKPWIFKKEIDQASPMILNALVNNENLTEVTFNFWQLDKAGVEKNYYRVEMVNGNLSSYDVRQGDIRDPDLAKLAVWEEIGLTYQKITWTILSPTTISASDDWEAPQV